MIHDEQHEQLVQSVLLGDLPESDAEFRHLIADCAKCRDEFHELRALAGNMDALGELERSAVAKLDAKSTAPGEEEVVATLRRLAGTAELRPRRGLFMLVAAAAGILLAFNLLHEPETTGEPSPLMGDQVELLSPTGSVEEFDAFRWRFSLPEAGHYEIRVRAIEPRSARTWKQRVSTEEWIPEPETLRELPDAVLWEVRVFDGSGNFVTSGEARAERSH